HPYHDRQPVDITLEHLGPIDNKLLHAPRSRRGLTDIDREVWKAMEQLPVKMIGICNVTAEQLDILCDFAEVKPTFVQNRCFAQLGWDKDVRRVCAANGIVYQGFSLLTANTRELASTAIRQIAALHHATV